MTNTCSESWILLNFVNQLKPELIQATFDNKLANRAFQEYLGKFPEFNFSERQKEFLLNLYEPLLNGFQFIIDKTPRYWEILKEIQMLFPKSKIVLLKRNPLVVAESMIKTWDLDSLSRLSYYKRDLLIAPKKILSFEKENLDHPNVYGICYEDLIENTGKEIQKLYNWMGVEYNPSVLDTSNNDKFKGNFGDPFLNSEKGYEKAKGETENTELTSTQKDFLKGYAYYLGEDFLLKYGEYKFPQQSIQKTLAFSYFMHLSVERNKTINLKKEIKYLLKEGFFKILKP